MYDNEDSVCGIIYNDEPYYFTKNLQGDIITIVDKNAQTVAKYSYDAWGVCDVTFDCTAVGIATINPYRYRSYYFDRETGLYYLQSRYYDASVGRFVNGDETAYLGTSGTVLGYNLFTYCDNDPICFFDYLGKYIMYIYGKDQEESAIINMELLKRKYYVYGYLVESYAAFQKIWNEKGTNRFGKLSKIDIVIINLHGNHRSVSYVNFNKLVKREIDTLLLLSCNAGHFDYIDTNPATRFYVRNDIRQLVCCDGTHYRTNTTIKRWKPTWLNWFRIVEEKRVVHSVIGDEFFKAACKSPRESMGFIMYTGKQNGVITKTRMIGHKFNTIMDLLSKIGK